MLRLIAVKYLSTATARATREFLRSRLPESVWPRLEEGHGGLYRYTKKVELDRIFDDAEKSLDHPMDFYEFYRVMAPTIAAIKCGHTNVSVPPDVREESESLPWLSLRREGAGVQSLHLPRLREGRELGWQGAMNQSQL